MQTGINEEVMAGMVKNIAIKLLLISMMMFLAACEAGTALVVPTDPPTETATFTPSPTRTPGPDASPTQRPSQVIPEGGSSPTPLFGATRTPLPDDFPTPTRPFNPNAPRIEFFTSDPLSIQPGGEITLYWSTRGVNNAVIYRLDEEGNRTQAYNVPPNGNLAIRTNRNDRGQLQYLLVLGEGGEQTEEIITIPLQCPVEWFFVPAPDDCPSAPAEETLLTDITMERGRMIYIEVTDTVYALFNDGRSPAWLSFPNRYNPEIHPSREENAPPEWIQPVDQLGFVWRSEGDVRSRLGLGIQEGLVFDGFVQTAPARGGTEVIYVSGANGVVLQILPGNEIWQIIGGPQ